jgi:cytochrome c-type biogenesis protein CcmH
LGGHFGAPHDGIGAALEGARDAAVRLAAVLRRLHLGARQLAAGDDADRLLLRSSESGRRRATRVPPSVARALVIALGTLLLVASAAAAAHVSEQTVHDVASQLRCVVCQNLSVADSPSEMATQMRAIVRERLEAGETPEQVREYFVARYGEWILLAPRRVGFNLLVWGFPLAALAVGFGVVALLLRRWTRRRRAAPAPPPVDAAMSERIRRELDAD